MLGDSVHPVDESAPHWRPIGDPVFNPLVATVIDPNDGFVLDEAAVAALAQGAIARGETILEAAINFWRGALDESDSDGTGQQIYLASSCGVGGQTLEELSRGADPELFNRLRECTKIARAVTEADGGSYGIAALLLLQGEHNSWGLHEGTTDRWRYGRLLREFYRDFVLDVAKVTAGQQSPPAMFLHQTGGAYASDDLAIAQAQLDAALLLPGCYMAAPSYPVTAKGGHLDANGYRWLGAQFGKVMHRVLTLGEDWKPLHPREARAAGERVVIDFHVPVGPLRWGRPFTDLQKRDIPDRGFAVVDKTGTVPLRSIEIEGRSVALTLSRPLAGPAFARYACRHPHGGRGCLHDSDATLADDCYVFEPGKGHYPDADIPELVGQRYPLMNWCVAFSLDIAG